MSNLWTLFKELLPNDALQIGKVVQVSGERSKIELPSGEFIWVSGNSVSVGNNAYFKGGIVVGEAPNLTVHNLTIY